jgi:hypothetical protein
LRPSRPRVSRGGAVRAVRRAPHRPSVLVALLAAIVATLAVAPTAPAQHAPAQPAPASRPESPPRVEPLNPMVVARSGLLVPGAMEPTAGWRIGASVEYGSVVERNLVFPDFYLLDAELLRVQLRARRGIGRRAVVEVEGGVAGATGGFADAFFEQYHSLIQWVMEERDARPRNSYGDRLYLARAGVDRNGRPRAALPSDVRATLGVAHGGGAQSVVTVTLPTAPAASRFARRVPSVSVVESVRRTPAERVTLTGSAGLGYTPRTGELRAVQRPLLAMVSGGAVVRVARAHAAYATLLYHTPPYRGTRFPELDLGEISVDFGYRWRSAGGRVWRVGLTEDTRRRDPGIDLVMKVSVE